MGWFSGGGSLTVNGSTLSSQLQEMLMASDILPGDAPSYQLCKTVYSFHPLGKKMVDSPLSMAQSQQRKIVVGQDTPDGDVVKQFQDEWKAINADRYIYNTGRLARVYGISCVALLVEGVTSTEPVDYTKLYKQTVSFNVLDALNTAGSLVLNQNPNSMDFLKSAQVVINGVPYHRSRSTVLMNEDPIYLEYTTSAFGYVGRSVYQRALFPLKTFVQTMITDDLVTLKAGFFIAKLKAVGAIINGVMQAVAGLKRNLIKEGQTGNVLSIDKDEDIVTIDMTNVDGPATMARKNVLENIATAADMPAKILQNETFAEGFGEGTEDAKMVAGYIDGIRVWLCPLYDYFDKIVMYRAWNEEFYKTLRAKHEEYYEGVDYMTWFKEMQNTFVATWPSLLREPESELVKVDEVKLNGMIASFEMLAPVLDPDNKAKLVEWAMDNLNDMKLLFTSRLALDIEALKNYEPPQPQANVEGGEPKPKAVAGASRSDAARARFNNSVARLVPPMQ